MRIAIPKERRAGETRVAVTPDSIKKYIALGAEVVVEAGAGAGAAIPDDAMTQAGATMAPDLEACLRDADIVLKVQRPLKAGEGEVDELALIPKGALLVGNLQPFGDREAAEAYARAGLTAFAMELMPRISRAQSLDTLSSQSNLAGYKAVVDAAAMLPRAFPLMMTAAGTVPPARVLVLGAGVAGLQAIATAKRLGAVVSAFDVRPAVKEQVQSLGGKFIEVPVEEGEEGETAGGYASEMSEDYKRRQGELVAETVKSQDVVISTALIPGKPAPRLVSAAMVESMKPGAIIMDLAAETGGNCELTRPGEIIEAHGVTIVGHLNVPARIPADASSLFARNLANFVTLMVKPEEDQPVIDWEDDVFKGTALTRDDKVVHPILIGGES
ncbi:MAG: Re/Si-specific NAD(P)(+) transhydrogenase subunit alpha [Alphaproteobacteria bacterium]